MRVAPFLFGVIACSRSHDRVPPVATAPRDAPLADAYVQPAWVTAALAHGGPGLCASVGTNGAQVYRRDARGRLVEALWFSAGGQGAIDERTEFTYDAAGRLTRTVRQSPKETSPNRIVDLWYDAAGRIVRRRTKYGDRSLMAGDTNVTYVWKGKAVAKPSGHIFTPVPEDPTEPIAEALAFAGTVREATYYDGSPAPQPEKDHVYTFDERGRLVEMVSKGWSDSADMRPEWDADDQLVALHHSGYRTTYEWRDHLVVGTRDYDLSGKLSGEWIYRYDAAHRLIESGHVHPEPQEHITSSTIDRDSGVLAVTTVIEDGDPARQTYHYDCGPAAP